MQLNSLGIFIGSTLFGFILVRHNPFMIYEIIISIMVVL